MFRFSTRISFIIGVILGAYLAVVYKSYEQQSNIPENSTRPFNIRNYKKWFLESNLKHQNIPFDTLRYSNKTFALEAEYLFKKIKVLCIIFVKTPKNSNAAQATWAKGCNKVQEISLTKKSEKIVVRRNRSESSWIYLCKTLKEIDENKYNWVLIVYDYTFVITENLRLFLASLNSEMQYYLGHAVEFWGTIYNSGQAGYVISRGTLKILKNSRSSSDFCTAPVTYMNKEDYYLGRHLAALNITPRDTRDSEGYSTFHPYNLYHAMFPSEGYYKFSVYPQKCCSPYTVAFQSIESDKMYTYYYFIYTLQLFIGGSLGSIAWTNYSTDDEIWKAFLKARRVPFNVTAQQYYNIWEASIDDPDSFMKHMKREEYDDYDLPT